MDFRVGDRVRFHASSATLLLYDRLDGGDEGTVASIVPDVVFVKWDRGGTMGIFAADVRLIEEARSAAS